MLGDQAIPPMLPSNNDRGCIRIIRIEFGSLADLVNIPVSTWALASRAIPVPSQRLVRLVVPVRPRHRRLPRLPRARRVRRAVTAGRPGAGGPPV